VRPVRQEVRVWLRLLGERFGVLKTAGWDMRLHYPRPRSARPRARIRAFRGGLFFFRRFFDLGWPLPCASFRDDSDADAHMLTTRTLALAGAPRAS
jgi:hypothetical protein